MTLEASESSSVHHSSTTKGKEIVGKGIQTTDDFKQSVGNSHKLKSGSELRENYSSYPSPPETPSMIINRTNSQALQKERTMSLDDIEEKLIEFAGDQEKFKGYVYVVVDKHTRKEGGVHFKIGSSRDVEQRIRTLKTGNTELEEKGRFYASNADSRKRLQKLEGDLRKKLVDENLAEVHKGEWLWALCATTFDKFGTVVEKIEGIVKNLD